MILDSEQFETMESRGHRLVKEEEIEELPWYEDPDQNVRSLQEIFFTEPLSELERDIRMEAIDNAKNS